eukprot:TRINITY_DN10941_c0_g1_i1.p1 TRINITY_DN10941_c0_g1~~TRINITY_DN10941_c0_g1_i1.p1  ORF type:complete len:310 (-),score=52.97 TRINITY_DN10941_c0_g1_i1:61-990(-)
MHLLFETTVGFVLFEVNEQLVPHILNGDDTMIDHFLEQFDVSHLLIISNIYLYQTPEEATTATSLLQNSTPPPSLLQFLSETTISNNTLCIGDDMLGTVLQQKKGLTCIFNDCVIDLMREVRESFSEHMPESIGERESVLEAQIYVSRRLLNDRVLEREQSSLQELSLLMDKLTDLNTNITNNYTNLQELYGYHFPELIQIIPDMNSYILVVKYIGNRSNLNYELLLEHIEEKFCASVHQASKISIGADVDAVYMNNCVGISDTLLNYLAQKHGLLEQIELVSMRISPQLSELLNPEMAALKILEAALA